MNRLTFKRGCLRLEFPSNMIGMRSLRLRWLAIVTDCDSTVVIVTRKAA